MKGTLLQILLPEKFDFPTPCSVRNHVLDLKDGLTYIYRDCEYIDCTDLEVDWEDWEIRPKVRAGR